MKQKWLPVLCILVVAGPLAGCAAFELESAILPEEMEMAETNGSAIVHGSLYGGNWSAPDAEVCPKGCGIYRVEYSTNLLFVLTSAVTLGLYVPQNVEWWCTTAAPDHSDEDFVGPDGTSSGGEQ